MKRTCIALLSAALLGGLSFPALAQAPPVTSGYDGALARAVTAKATHWDEAAMNLLIDQTNFVVDDKCSGTLISLQYRLILTNYHCVESNIRNVEKDEAGDDGVVEKVKREKREPIPVMQRHFSGFSEVGATNYVTEIVGYDKINDIALLEIKQEKLPFVNAAPLLPDGDTLMRGERTYTVGNPMMLEATVVSGEISSLSRQMKVEGGDKRDFIQFSGGVFGGNSGGALYNAKGQLIGIPAAGSPVATFIGLAIPIQSIKFFLKENCYASIWDRTAKDEDCRFSKKEKDKKDKAA